MFEGYTVWERMCRQGQNTQDRKTQTDRWCHRGSLLYTVSDANIC